jgi:RNA-binding protein 25
MCLTGKHFADAQRERRLEMRERQRIETLTRDANRIKHEDESEARERRALRERLAKWDDEEKIERGRELFYADRCVSN